MYVTCTPQITENRLCEGKRKLVPLEPLVDGIEAPEPSGTLYTCDTSSELGKYLPVKPGTSCWRCRNHDHDSMHADARVTRYCLEHDKQLTIPNITALRCRSHVDEGLA